VSERLDDRQTSYDEAEDRAVYVISVAAELAGVHPQTLRIYERKGLVRPQRTAGNSRRYSARDVARLRMIQRLTQEEGMNLAGVRMLLAMENELDQLRRRAERLTAELERERKRLEEQARQLAGTNPPSAMVPLAATRRVRLRISDAVGRREDGSAIPLGPEEHDI